MAYELKGNKIELNLEIGRYGVVIGWVVNGKPCRGANGETFRGKIPASVFNESVQALRDSLRLADIKVTKKAAVDVVKKAWPKIERAILKNRRVIVGDLLNELGDVYLPSLEYFEFPASSEEIKKAQRIIAKRLSKTQGRR